MTVKRKSRAVERPVEPGNEAECKHCEKQIKFLPPSMCRTGKRLMERKQIICNIYHRGVWRRVEHFHPSCYLEAGQPHGAPERIVTPQERRTAEIAREVEVRERAMALAGLTAS